MKLHSAKEVFEAFLAGKRLQNKHYKGEEIWLYLSEAGFICEEDGAGAKGHRVDLLWRDGDPEWETIEEAPFKPQKDSE